MKITIIVVMFFLYGCGGAEDREPSPGATKAFDELAETVDRAEAVEQQLQEQKERMDRALEDAEKPPESAHR